MRPGLRGSKGARLGHTGFIGFEAPRVHRVSGGPQWGFTRVPEFRGFSGESLAFWGFSKSSNVEAEENGPRTGALMNEGLEGT